MRFVCVCVWHANAVRFVRKQNLMRIVLVFYSIDFAHESPYKRARIETDEPERRETVATNTHAPARHNVLWSRVLGAHAHRAFERVREHVCAPVRLSQ